MSIERFYYLITDFLFAGTAILIIWHRQKRFLKKHWEFIMDFTLFSLPFGYLDVFAVKWGAWKFDPSRNLGFVIFGEHLEGYIFMGLIAAAISSYTISHAKVYGYKKTPRRQSINPRYKTQKPPRLIPASKP